MSKLYHKINNKLLVIDNIRKVQYYKDAYGDHTVNIIYDQYRDPNTVENEEEGRKHQNEINEKILAQEWIRLQETEGIMNMYRHFSKKN